MSRGLVPCLYYVRTAIGRVNLALGVYVENWEGAAMKAVKVIGIDRHSLFMFFYSLFYVLYTLPGISSHAMLKLVYSVVAL